MNVNNYRGKDYACRKIIKSGNSAIENLRKTRGGDNKKMENICSQYLNSEQGVVGWQWDYVRRT